MKELRGIAVDAAHSEKNKITEFQGVDLETGEILFYESLGHQTVNIGEFLAIVWAAKYILKNNYQPPIIYSDSNTAISWFKNKSTASKKKNKWMKKAEIYLKISAYWMDQIEVLKWDNKTMGETPADFGRK